MTLARVLFDCSTRSPIRYFLPKGVRNRIYMNFIRSLTRRAVEASKAHEIFSTRPLACSPHSPLKLWMVTAQPDLLMACWCLKSLIQYSGEVWDIWIADGGLDEQSAALLKAHFPGIQIVRSGELSELSVSKLRQFPLCSWLRHQRGYAPSIKLFDPLFHVAPHRFLLLDSDILFFRKPEVLLSLLRNEDNRSAHAFNLENGRINSGLGVIDPELIAPEDIERHLASMTSKQRWGWVVEQDLYASLVRDRFQGLPSEYAVQPISETQHAQCTTCHYIGVVRHRFFSQGIPRLRAAGFLEALANGTQSQAVGLVS